MLGRKRRVDYEAIVEFKRVHPHHYQGVIAEVFGISQKQVSRILRRSGIVCARVKGRRPLKHRLGWSKERYHWESLLVSEGLGMERGSRIGGQHIYYAEDPQKERQVSGE